jgi:restriction endonuclease Mrr
LKKARTVRGLYGVKTADKATKAILVTTSTFTKDAIEFVMPLKLEMELKDYHDITKWCKRT